MEAVLNAPQLHDSIPTAMKTQIAEWVAECERFLQWERAEMLLTEPTLETQACHRRSLEFLLKATQSMLELVSEPNLFDAQFHKELTALHARLAESWELFYNRISAEQARNILDKAFPG
jgi:hypothetical protein